MNKVVLWRLFEMIKKIAAVIAAACTTAVLSAYNPPVSGQSLDRLSSPTQLTSGSSAAGGGLFSAGPDAIVFNPALMAYEQRITLDAGYTRSEERRVGKECR